MRHSLWRLLTLTEVDASESQELTKEDIEDVRKRPRTYRRSHYVVSPNAHQQLIEWAEREMRRNS